MQIATSSIYIVQSVVITDINQVTKQFTDIIIDTATFCVKYKLNKKLKNKYKGKQEWFSNNCELMRKDVRRLGKKKYKTILIIMTLK